MKILLSSFGVGLLFAVGLGVSGMTDANKVIGFLNLAGHWDPSLAFVMVGGIGVHMALYRFILKRASPLFAERFRIPPHQNIDRRLIGGAILFGAGWGLSGYCPGPGIVSGIGFGVTALTFIATMLVGMAAFSVFDLVTSSHAPADEEDPTAHRPVDHHQAGNVTS